MQLRKKHPRWFYVILSVILLCAVFVTVIVADAIVWRVRSDSGITVTSIQPNDQEALMECIGVENQEYISIREMYYSAGFQERHFYFAFYVPEEENEAFHRLILQNYTPDQYAQSSLSFQPIFKEGTEKQRYNSNEDSYYSGFYEIETGNQYLYIFFCNRDSSVFHSQLMQLIIRAYNRQ